MMENESDVDVGSVDSRFAWPGSVSGPAICEAVRSLPGCEQQSSGCGSPGLHQPASPPPTPHLRQQQQQQQQQQSYTRHPHSQPGPGVVGGVGDGDVGVCLGDGGEGRCEVYPVWRVASQRQLQYCISRSGTSPDTPWSSVTGPGPSLTDTGDWCSVISHSHHSDIGPSTSGLSSPKTVD